MEAETTNALATCPIVTRDRSRVGNPAARPATLPAGPGQIQQSAVGWDNHRPSWQIFILFTLDNCGQEQCDEL